MYAHNKGLEYIENIIKYYDFIMEIRDKKSNKSNLNYYI